MKKKTKYQENCKDSKNLKKYNLQIFKFKTKKVISIRKLSYNLKNRVKTKQETVYILIPILCTCVCIY